MKSANGFFLMDNFTSVGTFHPLAKRTCDTHGRNLLSEMHDPVTWHYKAA
jgi:hypothetical protein